MTTSPNTPILNKILEKLESIDSLITRIELKVSEIDTFLTILEDRTPCVTFDLSGMTTGISSYKDSSLSIKYDVATKVETAAWGTAIP